MSPTARPFASVGVHRSGLGLPQPALCLDYRAHPKRRLEGWSFRRIRADQLRVAAQVEEASEGEAWEVQLSEPMSLGGPSGARARISIELADGTEKEVARAGAVLRRVGDTLNAGLGLRRR